jgi:small subunit ribosomal protein S17
MVRKEKIGVVVSTKQQKTVSVLIQTRYAHPKYGKILIKTKRYMAHDENETCQCGDIVLLLESSPFSRCKKWAVVKIVKPYSK